MSTTPKYPHVQTRKTTTLITAHIHLGVGEGHRGDERGNETHATARNSRHAMDRDTTRDGYTRATERRSADSEAARRPNKSRASGQGPGRLAGEGRGYGPLNGTTPAHPGDIYQMLGRNVVSG